LEGSEVIGLMIGFGYVVIEHHMGAHSLLRAATQLPLLLGLLLGSITVCVNHHWTQDIYIEALTQECVSKPMDSNLGYV
jgi:hypothetical protein